MRRYVHLQDEMLVAHGQRLPEETATAKAMTSQAEFQLASKAPSQAQKILAVLRTRKGQWVSMLDLWKASGAFAVHSRISDLRKRAHVIEHKNEFEDGGAVHSFYMLIE